jgi:hypothetical protein
MKTILSSFLAFALLLGIVPAGFAATKKSSNTKGSRGKNRSGTQRNAGRKKTNIPKNPN